MGKQESGSVTKGKNQLGLNICKDVTALLCPQSYAISYPDQEWFGPLIVANTLQREWV
jgi:hypothetical protein